MPAEPFARPARAKLLLKRTVDVVGALVGFALFAPLLLVLVVFIKLDSRGPVFFRQARLGMYGHPFKIWKLRTLVVDAVKLGAGLATYAGDPRVTCLGRMLRKYRIDEVPQLLNVLAGQMSLVGPRPLLPEFLSAYTENERRRLLVPPGMTGWQQVNGGSRNTWEERIELDLWYVDHWSVWLDLVILLRTVWAVLKADTVYGADGWQRSGCPTRIADEFKEASLDR